jgi:hypothetical protein
VWRMAASSWSRSVAVESGGGAWISICGGGGELVSVEGVVLVGDIVEVGGVVRGDVVDGMDGKRVVDGSGRVAEGDMEGGVAEVRCCPTEFGKTVVTGATKVILEATGGGTWFLLSGLGAKVTWSRGVVGSREVEFE